MEQLLQKPLTIPAGATGLSAAICLSGGDLLGFRFPSAWVTADITLQLASRSDPENFYNVLVSDAELVIGVPSDPSEVRLDSDEREAMRAIWLLKVRSGTTALPVDQTASPAIEVLYTARP